MICQVICENVRCLYQIEGYCRKMTISIDERGMCGSCLLVPDDIEDVNEIKDQIDFERDRKEIEYEVKKTGHKNMG